MKHVVWKPYWNYEHEEKWLNEMSAKGLALSSYSWCRYVFEDADRGEYKYRIMLLNNTARHPESQKQLAFYEEMGIEVVATYFRWVYLRKKATDGPFNLYSDIDSRITHYKRVAWFWFSLAFLELVISASNIITGLSDLQTSRFNLIIGIVLASFGVLFLSLGLPVLRKILKLKKQRRVNES